MAKSRFIDTKFWFDEYISDLDPSEKLVYIYLLTNHLTNICGIYELSLKQIAFDTGYDRSMVEKILTRFERDGKVKFMNGWIAIKNWIKHQIVEGNKNIEKGIEKGLSEAPQDMVYWVLNKPLEAPYNDLKDGANDLQLSIFISKSEYINTNNSSEPETVSEPVSVSDVHHLEVKTNQKPITNIPNDEIQLPEREVSGSFPVIGNKDSPIYKDEVAEWRSTYPACDIIAELKKMRVWLKANPHKLKTEKGIRRFIVAWLSRTQNSGGTK